jgi:hypothetical protein
MGFVWILPRCPPKLVSLNLHSALMLSLNLRDSTQASRNCAERI